MSVTGITGTLNPAIDLNAGKSVGGTKDDFLDQLIEEIAGMLAGPTGSQSHAAQHDEPGRTGNAE
ncbi:hypothetical protein [Burkholderia metallica]|uniref:hypothetical protein n=1 Tax=Burkholderia metallica TaxID=488729 RepID=UPI001CF3CEE3|nr:hypothetical protein [Burkholderia metallica]MCA8023642.1 hypothetical protein [Burkholderia metallica]